MNTTKKVEVTARVYLVLGVWLFVRLGNHGVVFYSHFPHCQVSKKAVLIFVNEMLSWLIEWFYWPANRWHWVWRCHILVPSQITLNPAGTKKKTWYQVCGELCWVDPSRYYWKRGYCDITVTGLSSSPRSVHIIPNSHIMANILSAILDVNNAN